MSDQTLRALARHLDARAGEVATALLGEPTQRTRRTWRWGSKGSLALEVAGPKAGRWFDHERGEGGDMLALIARERRAGLSEAAGWGRRFLGLEPGRAEAAPRRREQDQDARRAWRVELARRLWTSGAPIAGTIAETYIRRRGLTPPEHDAALRFHPRTPRGRNETLPAMLALMRDPVTGAPSGVQRIYLRPDGSDRLRDEMGKAMLGGRGVVMLDQLEADTLHLAEGVETTLAVRGLGFRPAWAATCAGAIATLPVLAPVRALVLFADADGAGMAAAASCAVRWRAAGRAVRILRPKEPGADWADVVRRAAA